MHGALSATVRLTRNDACCAAKSLNAADRPHAKHPLPLTGKVRGLLPFLLTNNRTRDDTPMSQSVNGTPATRVHLVPAVPPHSPALEDQALAFVLRSGHRAQHCTNRFIKHSFETLLRQR